MFLHDQLDCSADTLSHGRKQWLVIGMLLIQDPALLMLDESAAGISVNERVTTAKLLRRVISEGSIAHVRADCKALEVYLGH